jgi:nucleotide-binding universal stress UspA family protein
VEVAFVREPVGFDDRSGATLQHLERRAQAYVDSMAHDLAERSSVDANGTVREGTSSAEICGLATEIKADLIVMTTNGRTGLRRLWVGSVARDVLRRACTPVLLLRPIDRTARIPRQRRVETMLITFDGSAKSEAIIESALDLALALEARVELLRVVGPMPFADDTSTMRNVAEANAYLETIAKRLKENGVGVVNPHVVVGKHAATAILEFIHRAEPSVVAMATHGRGVSRFVFGSVSDQVLRAAHAPLLLRGPTGVM